MSIEFVALTIEKIRERLGKMNQISFRVDRETAAKIESAAEVEELQKAGVVRKLVRLALVRYKEVGSLHELKRLFEYKTLGHKKQNRFACKRVAIQP